MATEDVPPWVFAFDPCKVAAHRLACAIRLGRPEMALQGARDTGILLAAPTKQAALWHLDQADAHLQAGHLDRAIEIAIDGLDSTTTSHSARIINRARRLRQTYSGATPPGLIRDLDEGLRASRL